jgi:eukaryotic-like serine/threonine-protein kinase
VTTPLAPQTTLADRYLLLERIAVGGMGEVWRARDEVLSRTVAVKVLKPEYAADPSFLARFRAEAQHAAGLSHPGVANVFDYGEAGGPAGHDLPYLVMECVDGEPLSVLLGRDGPLPPDRTLDIVGQAALALQAAHDAGFVHRDVKPGNLLIRPDGVVKVTDFGIARAVDAAPVTKTGLVVGTAAYLSPEQAAGKPVTPASDIYALGVVTYECLTGRRPFDDASPVAVAMAHMNTKPPALPKDVPPLVADFVTRALDKDPARRQPSAGDFGRTALALAATLRGAEPSASAAPEHPPTKLLTAAAPIAAGSADDERERRRIRNIFIAVGAAVVVAGFLLLHSCASSPSTPARTVTPRPTPSVTSVTVRAADYLGRPASTVRAALTTAGFKVVQTSVVSQAAAGSVVGVSPTGTLRRGSTITITVAKAPTPTPTPAPPKRKHGHGGGGDH